MKGMGTQGRNRSSTRGNSGRAAAPGVRSGGDPPTLGNGPWAWLEAMASARTGMESRSLRAVRNPRRSLALIMPGAPQLDRLLPTEEADLHDRPHCGPVLAYRMIRLWGSRESCPE